MGNLLLIISCSKTKINDKNKLPAIDRYDGPIYRSIRKMMYTDNIPKNMDIKIVSAKFGLIDKSTPIGYYDQKMTKRSAKNLNAQVVNELKRVFINKSYSEIFVNLGKNYLPSIIGFERYTDAKIIYASGKIGEKTKQMKQWIESHLA